jgi:hypothetical protein
MELILERLSFPPMASTYFAITSSAVWACEARDAKRKETASRHKFRYFIVLIFRG